MTRRGATAISNIAVGPRRPEGGPARIDTGRNQRSTRRAFHVFQNASHASRFLRLCGVVEPQRQSLQVPANDNDADSLPFICVFSA